MISLGFIERVVHVLGGIDSPYGHSESVSTSPMSVNKNNTKLPEAAGLIQAIRVVLLASAQFEPSEKLSVVHASLPNMPNIDDWSDMNVAPVVSDGVDRMLYLQLDQPVINLLISPVLYKCVGNACYNELLVKCLLDIVCHFATNNSKYSDIFIEICHEIFTSSSPSHVSLFSLLMTGLALHKDNVCFNFMTNYFIFRFANNE